MNGTPVLFLKPENYGLRSVGATAMHGIDYIRTRGMVAAVIGAKVFHIHFSPKPKRFSSEIDKISSFSCFDFDRSMKYMAFATIRLHSPPVDSNGLHLCVCAGGQPPQGAHP